ncbi:non-specific lipid-transfer protein 2-like [Cucurbita moschata]|uniref:Non-specific lipid-transfer protein 2-like n=1 Tax=Cucurbita moschata TaxID=3662 RepID=A0A6J1GV37_CUCMO|nr:non-specific lipid-transfer protein 2-like [Cucurbita moschata]
MKRLSISSLCVLVAAVATMALLTGAPVADAVDCNPSELSPCLPAITSSTPPTSSCCQKMVEQTPCLCGYFKNPEFKPYVTGGKRVAAACGLTVPEC